MFFSIKYYETRTGKVRKRYGYGYGRNNHFSSTGTERVWIILRSGEYVTGTGFFELKLRCGYVGVRVRTNFNIGSTGTESVPVPVLRSMGSKWDIYICLYIQSLVRTLVRESGVHSVPF